MTAAPPWLPDEWLAQLPADDASRARCLRCLTTLGNEVSAPLPLLRNYIDDSRYGVDQWLAAIAAFDHWLEEAGRSSPVAHQMNYLHCATWSREADLGWPLNDLLHEMLENYGYDGPAADDETCQL